MGKRRRPRPINRHATLEAAGYWGPRRFILAPWRLPLRFSARPSPAARWARGLLSAFWERGSPDLPACGLRRGSKEAQHGPSSSTQEQDPREGPSLAGRTTQSFLRRGLIRLAHEEAERSRRGTSRGAHDASHDDQGCQAGASPRSVLPFLFGAKGASASERIKQRHPFRCNETKTSPTVGRRSSWSPERRHQRAFSRRGPTLVRISVLYVPLRIGQLL